MHKKAAEKVKYCITIRNESSLPGFIPGRIVMNQTLRVFMFCTKLKSDRTVKKACLVLNSGVFVV